MVISKYLVRLFSKRSRTERWVVSGTERKWISNNYYATNWAKVLSMASVVQVLGGLTWALLYVPIKCTVYTLGRGLRSASGKRPQAKDTYTEWLKILPLKSERVEYQESQAIVLAWLSYLADVRIFSDSSYCSMWFHLSGSFFLPLKVHKIENFFGSEFEFYNISLLLMLKY